MNRNEHCPRVGAWINRLAVMTIAGALLGGCVTHYQLSEAAVSASKTMTQKAALQIVQNQFASTDKQVGFCQHFMYPPVNEAAGDLILQQPVKMNGPVVEMKYVQAEIGGGADDIIRGALGWRGTKRNEVERYSYAIPFDMTKVAQARVGEKGSLTSCKGRHGDVLVELVNQEPRRVLTHRLAFRLAPEDLEIFLATVKRLSPEVIISQ
jgi:hypothetical protein